VIFMKFAVKMAEYDESISRLDFVVVNRSPNAIMHDYDMGK